LEIVLRDNLIGEIRSKISRRSANQRSTTMLPEVGEYHSSRYARITRDTPRHWSILLLSH